MTSCQRKLEVKRCLQKDEERLYRQSKQSHLQLLILIDKNTEKQLIAKNVIVVYAAESVANDGYEGGEHMLYDIIGSGDALIFQNGEAMEGTWNKASEEDLMTFENDDGDEIKMVRGQVWISILPEDNEVDYNSGASN